MKKLIQYETKDGCKFDNYYQALIHEQVLDLEEVLLYELDGSEMSRRVIAEVVLQNLTVEEGQIVVIKRGAAK